MLKKKAKPHRVTRLVILFASVAGLLSVLGSDNNSGKIFALIFFARAAYLFVMSLLYGVGGATRLDRVCLVIAVLAIFAYAVTKNDWLSLSLAVLADFIGYIPTFVKTWRDPKSEDPVFFAIEGLASLFGLIAVGEWSIGIVLPLYFALSSGLVLGLIYRPLQKRKQVTQK